eukprot:179010-Amorphochlora_amoeboformis.AAC.1
MSRVGWRGLRCCTLVLQVIALAFLATSFGAVDPFKTGMVREGLNLEEFDVFGGFRGTGHLAG